MYNCYSSAHSLIADSVGGLAGNIANVENCYYLNASANKGLGETDSDVGIMKSDVNMKKEAFAESLGDAFFYNENDYPVLYWEKGLEYINIDKKKLKFTEYNQQETITSTNEKVSWKSSDESVAKVDKNGVVTAVGNGNCIITAYIGESKATCQVNVSYNYYLKESGFRLDVDKAKSLVIISANSDEVISNDGVIFTSTSSDIASVGKNGVISANMAGVTYINAKIGDQNLRCKVIVNTLEGDVNQDGYITIADAVMLQQWLLCSGNITNWEAGDLYEDGRLDTFDMVMLRKLIVEKTK